MAQEKSKVEEQIRALGNFSRWMVRREIESLPQILRADEKLHALTSGRFRNQNNWLVIVTDQRVLCLYKGIIFGMKQIELPVSQISAVAHKTGLMFGDLIATTSGGIEVIDWIDKKDVIQVASALSEVVSLQGRRQTS